MLSEIIFLINYFCHWYPTGHRIKHPTSDLILTYNPTPNPTSILTSDPTSDLTSDMTSPSYCCSGLAPQRKNFGDYEGSLRTGSVMEVIWKHRQVLSSVKFHFFPPTFQWAGFVSGLVRIGPVRRFRSRLCTWHHQGVPGLQGCTWPHHSVQPSIHLHTRILNYP